MNQSTNQASLKNKLKCPDVILLNEIKIDPNESNIYFNFKNYQPLVKARNKKGGGVAILVKEGIEFVQDRSFDDFSAELLFINNKTPTYNITGHDKSSSRKLDFKKANWGLFREILSLLNYQLRFLARDIDELNEHINQKILNAAHKSLAKNEEKLGEISKKLAAKLKIKFCQLTSELQYKTKREKGIIFGDYLASTFSSNADLIDPNKDRKK
ncbi:hypothetical protein BpHYR1_014159 [Brachionus plicatilis]|uniref:Endonuclease/exonuclease/phosphatase domain-containing protein n=1 Tax=Brachionus plicatilis TaxID=10195 RepID=A0A3M7RCT1_BRAPC|nr:hypothetical protein BpHYR1_014159 [Brachionus plicatilis]